MNTDKLAARQQWNTHPCGVGDYLTGIEYGSLEFFDAIRRSRYQYSDEWMMRTIPFSSAQSKRLLEIGHGIGTDLLTFCEAGAEAYGIDLAEEHHRLATLNFALHGKKCVLKICDAANIDFPSEFFDIVYSNGVLHHTPDTVRCIAEAYRVLKPGGQFVFSLYYKYSAFHSISMLLYHGVIRGKLLRLGYRGLMATVERGADGVNIKPLVKTYTKTQLRHILSDFSKVEFKIAHFKREHIPFLGRIIPRVVERALERYVGWYVVAFATK